MDVLQTQQVALVALLRLPDKAIFAIVDDFNKVAYISYTSTLKARLGQICHEISSGTFKHKFNTTNTEIKILETCDDRVLVKYYVDDYRNNGYTIVAERIPVQYSFSMVFEEVIRVVARNKRNDRIVLGEFDNVDEATEYLKFVKKNNITNNLVYSVAKNESNERSE